jgi:hypothetical protein
MFPFQPLVPAKRFRDVRSVVAWPILSQAERKYRYETTAQPRVVYEDWRQVNREQGDLLYVGAASATSALRALGRAAFAPADQIKQPNIEPTRDHQDRRGPGT